MICLSKLRLSRNRALLLQQGRAVLMAAFIAVGLAFIATTAQAASTIRYVTTGGTDAGGCDLPATPCQTIAYALTQSATGDDIRVGSGTYSELEISVSIGVTITGGFDV